MEPFQLIEEKGLMPLAKAVLLWNVCRWIVISKPFLHFVERSCDLFIFSKKMLVCENGRIDQIDSCHAFHPLIDLSVELI